MSKYKNYLQTVLDLIFILPLYALVLKGEEKFCKISLKIKVEVTTSVERSLFFLSFDSSSEEERPMDAFYLCCSFKRYSWRKNPRINHFKHASTNHLLPLQLIQKSKANFNKIKNSKKIALAQCKHGKKFLPFIFRLYILRCMTPAATARGVAERIPSPSTITLIPWGDAFLEDLTKKPRRPLLPPAPLRQKWCSPFQLWLQRISIKCSG